MKVQNSLEKDLKGIRQLLSHLHSEISSLEAQNATVLQALRKFESLCDTDELTGLRRRNSFMEKWTALIQECQKLEENCGILMMDVDFFKRINDTHGHATGDEVLRRVSGLLKQFESPNCVAGRLGGEEFAMAIRGTEAEVHAVAEMVRKNVESLQSPVPCTISIGTASTKRKGLETSELLKAADEALYAAKHAGRNRVKAA